MGNKFMYRFVVKMGFSWCILLLIALIIYTAGCKEKPKKQVDPKRGDSTMQAVSVPVFSADSAYTFIAQQVAFGPRVPGTTPHVLCGDWLVAKLQNYAGEENVMEQKATVKMFDDTEVEARNIIALFNPDAKFRILLCAHWDTRMFSDHDVNPDNRLKPVAGANDGGSGVAVLLELARHFSTANWTDFGVDIVLFDVEDQGFPDNLGYKQPGDTRKTWCLGSQYWAANRHRPSFNYQYGILLDMVGAEDAIFPREGHSVKFAPRIVKMIWNTARDLGYGNYFSGEMGVDLIDDHYFINKIAKIPTVDIIHHRPLTGGFSANWHTQYDDMKGISKAPLMAVGHTIMQITYLEAAGKLDL